jgi:hypothetical protein
MDFDPVAQQMQRDVRTRNLAMPARSVTTLGLALGARILAMTHEFRCKPYAEGANRRSRPSEHGLSYGWAYLRIGWPDADFASATPRASTRRRF